MKDIKELGLRVGTTPDVSPQRNTRINFNSMGGFNTNADTVFSMRQSTINKDFDNETEEDDEDMEDIFLHRKKINGKYSLTETYDAINENIFTSALKSAALGIPGLDAYVGTAVISDLSAEATEALRLADKAFEELAGIGQGKLDTAIALLGTQQHFNQLIMMLKTAPPQAKAAFQESFDEMLKLLKNLITTTLASYDSIVALAAGPAAVVAEPVTNVITSVMNFVGENVPFEKFVLDLVSQRSGFIAGFIDLMGKIQSLIMAGGYAGKILGYFIGKLNKDGGALVENLINKPQEFLRRIGDIQRALDGQPVESEISLSTNMNKDTSSSSPKNIFESVCVSEKGYSLLGTLNNLMEGAKPDFLDLDKDGDKEETMKKAAKDKKKKDEEVNEESFDEIDLEEFSSMAGGSISGPILPLGKSNKPASKTSDHIRLSEKEKQVNEQRERIAILQAYHQKTTNKLK